MVAKLLGRTGVSLGAPKDLLSGDPHNEEGYFENRQFAEFNEDLLAYLGGGWDTPPVLEPGWEDAKDLAPFRDRAAEIVEGNAGDEPWGWKDPRNSLTLPFWLSQVPDLSVLLCVRHPVEVAQSLYRRSNSSAALSLGLWLTYNRSVLQAVAPARLVVTHYDSYFEDPRRELSRILEALNFPIVEEAIANSCEGVMPALRHNLSKAPIPAHLLDCYAELVSRAGPVYEAAARGSRQGGDTGLTLFAVNRDLHESVRPVFQEIADLRAHNELIERSLDAANTKVKELEAQLRVQRSELDSIKGSEGWAILQMLWRGRLALAPPGSQRELVGRRVFGAIRNIGRRD